MPNYVPGGFVEPTSRSWGSSALDQCNEDQHGLDVHPEQSCNLIHELTAPHVTHRAQERAAFLERELVFKRHFRAVTCQKKGILRFI